MREEDEQKRNMIIFFAITMLIMIGYPYIFRDNENTSILQQNVVQTQIDPNLVVLEESQEENNKVETITIDSNRLSGHISTQGALFNDIILKDYKTEYNSNENVSVFDKSGYYVSTSWICSDSSIRMPNKNSHWKSSGTKLTTKIPIILTWDNKQGLLFTKIIKVDENFVFTITDTVKNYGTNTIKLSNSVEIFRQIDNKQQESVGFYSGPIGYFDKKLNEIEYEDIEKKGSIEYSSKGGWFGISDKYWLVSFIPEQNSSYKVSYKYVPSNNNKAYLIKNLYSDVSLEPSVEFSKTQHLFIGAKEIQTLDMYEKKLNIPHFDLVIDFGRLYILTKPLLYSVSYMKNLVGNMGLGILLITLLLKLILLPLANRSYRSMNRMKDIQPKIQELQKRYANDQARLGQAVSELYRKEKLNPIGGCLPMFLQWPILFALYKVLYISIEMRQAPFFGWIHDLSIADPWYILNLGGLIPVSLPGFLQIGIWPLLMGLSMWIQQKMGPAPADPAQGKIMIIMPIMFTFMFAQLPSGLVIYWTFSNLLAILQQYVIKKLDCTNNSKAIKTEVN